MQGAFSPDGSHIAYWKDSKYWISGRSGEDEREIVTLDTRYEFRGPKWSPDGKRLVYLKNKFGSGESAVEAHTLVDNSITAIFEGKGLLDFWLTSGGRLIYSQAAASEEPTYELWEVLVDPHTAKSSGQPHRLTRWVGYSPGFVSVSADGKRIVTTKGYSQSDVYVAELEAGGRTMKPQRRVTLDTRSDWPTAWTQDDREILFFSDRNGAFNIFRQGEAAQSPEQVLRGRDDARAPQISPDGQWLLYMAWPDLKRSSPVRIMRIPRSGGAAQAVFEAKGAFATGITFSPGGDQDLQLKGPKMFPDFRCPSASPKPFSCILAEAEHDEVVFTFFDPADGRGGEAARLQITPAKLFWDLAPDGSRIAYGEFKSSPDDRVIIRTLQGTITREVPVTGWTTLNSLSWSADGRDLFVTTLRREGSDLLRVTPDGNVVALRQETGRWFASPRPSHNGRLLAFAVRTTDSNVWLIEAKAE